MRTSFSSVIASGATAILDERIIAKPRFQTRQFWKRELPC
jgi:hypothetical protein